MILQAVAQPLDDGAADEDAALERVLGDAAARPRDRGEQVVARSDRLRAGVHQQEAAGAVGVLREPGRVAGLAEQRRLLVAGDAGDRHVDAVEVLRAPAPPTRARPAAAPHAARRAARAARRPSRRGGCRRAACGTRSTRRSRERVPRVRFQTSQLSIGAEGELAALRRAPLRRARGRAATRAWCRRSRRRARARSSRANVGAWPAARNCVAAARRAPVLPDDRVRERPAGGALPQHRRLALVGDADRGEVGGADARGGERLVQHAPTALPRSRSGRARPSRAAGRSGGTPAARRRTPARGGRRRSRASWSCPGRARGRRASGLPP